MIYDENGKELGFLEMLSLASSIVWFKSIGESAQWNVHLDEEFDVVKAKLQEMDSKLDKILGLLDK